VQYFRAVEVQKRGALHLHVLIVAESAVTVEQLHELALASGFGCVLDLQAVTTTRAVAAYLSKYVSKSADVRGEVPWLKYDRLTGEILSDCATYRTYTTSQRWGCSMGQIRDALRSARAARSWTGADEGQPAGSAAQPAAPPPPPTPPDPPPS
jgi:hypothetical protein